jgi:hypothetical protein
MTSRRTDEQQDRTVEDSFPASDPPAATGIVGPRVEDAGGVTPGPSPTPPETCDAEGVRPTGDERGARPKDTPTDERHTTETASRQEHEERPPQRQPRP